MKHLYNIKIVLLIVVLNILHTRAAAQNFHLLKDINASKDANPTNNVYNSFYHDYAFAVLNNIVYFNAEDGITGKGLWRSDGTAAGTYLVKAGLNPTNITISNGIVFFTDRSAFNTLWKSDGTDSGTVHVLDTVPSGFPGFHVSNLIDFKDALYFTVNTNTGDDQLWKTDGTEAGTKLVKNFNPSFYALADFKVVKNELYFSALDYYFKLFVSDGSAAGTHLISNNISFPAQVVAGVPGSSDSIYFSGAAVDFGPRFLYVSNGDSGNAVIPAGFNGVLSENFDHDLIKINNWIYFIGHPDTSSRGEGLYRFNVKATDGIQPVMVFNDTSATVGLSAVSSLRTAFSKLFFTVRNAQANTNQFWTSNGTDSGNVLLKDNLAASNFLFVSNGLIYFKCYDNIHGSELWKTNGTANGTVLFSDINPGINSSDPYGFVLSGNKLIFAALNQINGVELWQSDGTQPGTSLIKDVNQTTTSSSDPTALQLLNNTLIFSANDGKGAPGNRLWKSNGTAAGTVIINDTIFSLNSTFQNSVIINNETFFWGTTISGRQGLCKTDGSFGGTVLVKDFTDQAINPFSAMAAGNGLVYFSVYNGRKLQAKLWRSDGTDANTFAILSPSNNGINLNTFATVGNISFFRGQPTQLWKTDGTIVGTMMLKAFPYEIEQFYANNGLLFFSGSANTPFNSLWKSNGTSAGTVSVSNKISYITNIFSSSSNLFVGAAGGLYTSDGTDTGTVLISNIQPDHNSNPFSINDTVYFFIGSNLWRSDGTVSGTLKIKDLGGSHGNIIRLNGKLFVLINEKNLWESDGTAAGTHEVADLLFSSSTNSFQDLTVINNQLFFTGYNYQFGEELYAGTIGSALPVKLLSFTGTLENTDGLLKWTTANEQNNSYFNLQRSADGAEFRTIVKMKGAGTTSQKTDYDYTDKNIVQLCNHKLYYRLQQVDQDGTATFSNIVIITMKAQPQFIVSPNPVKNSINVYSTLSIDNANITLTDMNGKVLFATHQMVPAGQPVRIESASIAKGVYIVSIENGGTASRIKVVKE